MIGFWANFFTFVQVLVAVFLIFIIMLQRGKGGGLVGALGGMGGASAFGPKADVHVLKLTIGAAMVWVVVTCVSIFVNRSYHGERPVVSGSSVQSTGAKDSDEAADGEESPLDAATTKDKAADKAAEKTTAAPVEKSDTLPTEKSEAAPATGDAATGDAATGDAATGPASDAPAGENSAPAEQPAENK